MTFKDFLKITNKDEFVHLHINMYDMNFSTYHSVEHYIKSDSTELLEKEVARIYTNMGEMHVRLEG